MNSSTRYGTEQHTIIGGNGEVFVNGKRIKKKQRVQLSVYDRVVIGGEVRSTSQSINESVNAA